MPGLLQASAVGSRIDLAWLTTYPPSTSYEAEWSANGKTDWQAVDPPDEDSDTIYSHSGLTGSTVYYYRGEGRERARIRSMVSDSLRRDWSTEKINQCTDRPCRQCSECNHDQPVVDSTVR